MGSTTSTLRIAQAVLHMSQSSLAALGTPTQVFRLPSTSRREEVAMAYPKLTIERVGDGWLVKGQIVRDMGDGIPWPYEHESVYETADAMLQAITADEG
jgi:hypothetical protein